MLLQSRIHASSHTRLIVLDAHGSPLPGAIVEVPGTGNITTDDHGSADLSISPSSLASTCIRVFYNTSIGMISEKVKPRVSEDGVVELRTNMLVVHLLIQPLGGNTTVTLFFDGSPVLHVRGTGDLVFPTQTPGNGSAIPHMLGITAGFSKETMFPLVIENGSARIPVFQGDNMVLLGVEPSGSPNLVYMSNVFYRCGMLGGYYGALELGFRGNATRLSLIKGVVVGRLSFLSNIEERPGGFTIYYPLKNCVYGYVVKPGETVILEFSVQGSNYRAVITVPGLPYTQTISSQSWGTSTQAGVAEGQASQPGVVEAGGKSSSGSGRLTALIAVSAAIIAVLAAILVLASDRGGEKR